MMESRTLSWPMLAPSHEASLCWIRPVKVSIVYSERLLISWVSGRGLSLLLGTFQRSCHGFKSDPSAGRADVLPMSLPFWRWWCHSLSSSLLLFACFLQRRKAFICTNMDVPKSCLIYSVPCLCSFVVLLTGSLAPSISAHLFCFILLYRLEWGEWFKPLSHVSTLHQTVYFEVGSGGSLYAQPLVTLSLSHAHLQILTVSEHYLRISKLKLLSMQNISETVAVCKIIVFWSCWLRSRHMSI